jgi:DNA invertase Pin-like site-specific DNA recombinase
MTANATAGYAIGYARVSTDDQDAQLQLDALHAAGCVKIFTDKASGKTTDGRPELDALLEYVRPGDVVTVWKLDRMARSVVDLIKLIDGLATRGIGFKVLTGALSGIDTTTADGRLFLTMIAGFAEFERSLIVERTKAGLEAAKAQGRTGGRPSALTADQVTIAKALKNSGKSLAEIAKALGVGKTTIHRVLSQEAA